MTNANPRRVGSATLILILLVASLVAAVGYDHYNLSNEISGLESRNMGLQSEVSSINNTNIQNQVQISTLSSELASLKSNNTQINSQVSALESEITADQNEISSLTTSFMALNVTLTSKISSLAAQVTMLQNQVGQLQQQLVALRTELGQLNPFFDIIQHVYVIPQHPEANVSVTLPLPVSPRDLIVVGAVFGKNISGTCQPNGCPFNVAARINASVSSSLGYDLYTSSNGISESQYNSFYITDMGSVIWWGTAGSGDETFTVKGPATQLVDVFELADTNGNPNVSAGWFHAYVANGSSFDQILGGIGNGTNRPFVFVIGVTDAISTAKCVPDHFATAGFIIEPYCGTESPFTGEQLYGEYAATNASSFFSGIDTGPLPTPYSLVGVVFYVSIR